MIKQLWKPRYNTLQVYLKYFPIELQSIYFSGILTKMLSFLSDFRVSALHQPGVTRKTFFRLF